ncbi:MAG: HU family DNA-binding protein [Alphaproteobacteria bacterium]|nr:HU family DNA-binding protein [Alphaproteobacteria bacterium]
MHHTPFLLAAGLAALALPAHAMNKAELIDAIATDAGLSKADARRALDALSQATAEQLSRGAAVHVEGLGVLSRGAVFRTADGTDPEPATFDYVHAPDALDVKLPGQQVVRARDLVGADTAQQALDSLAFLVADRLDHDEPMDVRGLGTFYVALEVPLGAELRGVCCLRKRPGGTRKADALDDDSDDDSIPTHAGELRIAAKKVARFKAGKALADQVK